MPDSPAQSTNLQGQTLANGRFLITNLLGSGGMADVYRAYDNRTQRDVAVKLPKLNLLGDEEFVKRFDREIKIMVGLEHPHIVPVLFAGKHEDHTFAVFPYLTGGSLGDQIKAGQYSKPPTTSADLVWLTQIALALDHLHSQGLLHRDVKPENILFDADGKAYLSDFGIVRALDAEKGGKAVTQLTAADMTIGTAPYMALELLLAKTPYTATVDQYALAVTLYEAFTGQKPYDGSAKQIVFDLAQRAPQPLTELRRDLPPLVGEAVHRALSQKSDKRFGRSIEFAQAVMKSFTTPKARNVVKPALGKLVSAGETVRAPTQKPTRQEALSRRSAPTETPAPNSPSAYAPGSPRRWWIIAISIAAVLLVTTLLFISSSRPQKRDSHVKKSKVTPSLPPMIPKIEKYITNSIGMKLVRLPAGKFTMGSPASEIDRQDDEGPQHEVHITKPFYIGVYEVTQAQYQQVIGTNPSYFSSSGRGKDKVVGMNTKDFPVEYVMWNEAVEFCKKLSELPKERAAGRVYCLPSEAEWEYTCRGGSISYQVFHFGNSPSSTQLNSAVNGPFLGRPTTVGSYQPNAFGVYDMHGNVSEWCRDWFDEDYYGNSPLRDPINIEGGWFRVDRGGGFNNGGVFCRAACRNGHFPSSRDYTLGFRAALVPSGE